MRKTYKFSHSVVQGGYLYAHKVKRENIRNKDGLRNLLTSINRKYELIDMTVKIYDDVFFLFFMKKPEIEYDEIIRDIQKNIHLFGEFSNEYIFTTTYDLQEEHVRKDLKKLGYDYDMG